MKTSKQLYTELTPEGLANRKEKEHTSQEIKYLKRILNKKYKILDLACGYGRFTIPLAKQGYKIEGIDITPSLIKKAKELSNKSNLKIMFRVGDMRRLPYQKENRKSVVCMWSAFNELYKEKDQESAIKEMLRILSYNGFVFIEMPYTKKVSSYVRDVKRRIELRKIGNRINVGKISGVESMPSYAHNKTTLLNLMKKTKIKKI